MRVHHITAVVMLQMTLLGTTFVEAQRPTLPEIAKRFAPQPIHQVRVVELLPDTLEELVAKSDLIIHGTIERATTYLADDQADLYTDYFIATKGIIVGKAAHLAQIPGIPPHLVVKRWGGEMVIENVQVKQELDHLRYFHVGEEVVLALKLDDADAKYELVGGGAFMVKADTLASFIGHPRHHPYYGLSVTEFSAAASKAATEALQRVP
jgi:hypothetical protein